MKYCTSFKEIASAATSNRAAWKYVRKLLREGAAKRDSERLFNAVIRHMQKLLAACGEIDDLEGTYNWLVGQRVNNDRSEFYLYG